MAILAGTLRFAHLKGSKLCAYTTKNHVRFIRGLSLPHARKPVKPAKMTPTIPNAGFREAALFLARLGGLVGVWIGIGGGGTGAVVFCRFNLSHFHYSNHGMNRQLL